LEDETKSSGTGFEVHNFFLITAGVFDHVTEFVGFVVADFNDFLIKLFEVVDVGFELVADVE
jgi:hypothetical protein